MSTVRITLDLPSREHKKLKTTATLLGLSMKDIVMLSLEELYKNEAFNKQTQKAIGDAEKGRNVKRYDSVGDLFEALGL